MWCSRLSDVNHVSRRMKFSLSWCLSSPYREVIGECVLIACCVRSGSIWGGFASMSLSWRGLLSYVGVIAGIKKKTRGFTPLRFLMPVRGGKNLCEKNKYNLKSHRHSQVPSQYHFLSLARMLGWGTTVHVPASTGWDW